MGGQIIYVFVSFIRGDSLLLRTGPLDPENHARDLESTLESRASLAEPSFAVWIILLPYLTLSTSTVHLC